MSGEIRAGITIGRTLALRISFAFPARRRAGFLACFLACFLVSVPGLHWGDCQAAEIAAIQAAGHANSAVVRLRGTIEHEDSRKLRKATTRHPKTVVVLANPGARLEPVPANGPQIRKRKSATAVKPRLRPRLLLRACLARWNKALHGDWRHGWRSCGVHR